MKSSMLTAALISLVSAQDTGSRASCPFGPNGSYCAGGSLVNSIIIQCTGGIGVPGNCNNILGVSSTLCYQSGPSTGDAVCIKNGILENTSPSSSSSRAPTTTTTSSKTSIAPVTTAMTTAVRTTASSIPLLITVSFSSPIALPAPVATTVGTYQSTKSELRTLSTSATHASATLAPSAGLPAPASVSASDWRTVTTISSIFVVPVSAFGVANMSMPSGSSRSTGVIGSSNTASLRSPTSTPFTGGANAGPAARSFGLLSIVAVAAAALL